VKDEIRVNETVLAKSAAARGAGTPTGKFFIRYWAEAVIVVVSLLLWAPRLSGPIDLRWDGSVYYMLGTSLATGQGYRILSEPGSPEALQYPPLLPAVVAVHEWALGTTNPDVVAPWLRKLYFVIFVAYALAVLALARRYLRPWFALAATTLCLLHLYTIFLSDLLFAELPFALVSVLFVLVAASGPPPSRPWLREMAAFALAAAGFLLRTAGVALFAAWIIEALTRRRWRLALARGALALVPIALWQAHVERVRTSDEYVHPAYEYQRAPYQYYNVAYAENIRLLDPFRPERGLADRHALVTRLVTNFTKMPAAIGGAVSTNSGYWGMFLREVQYRLPRRAVIPRGVLLVPIFGLAALVVAGLVVLIRRGTWLMVFIVLGSVALTCTTPWPGQFVRYLMPIAPFLTIAAVLASERFEAALRRSVWTTALARTTFAALLLLAFTVQVYAALSAFCLRGPAFTPRGGGWGDFRFFYHDNSWRAWEEAVAWIDAHAAPDAIVATNAPHFCYLRTSRHAVLPPMEADRARARRLLEAVPISYVIVDELESPDVSRRYARPAVENDPVGWHLVYSVNGVQIYERVTGAQQ
jgi:hypothetical protein